MSESRNESTGDRMGIPEHWLVYGAGGNIIAVVRDAAEAERQREIVGSGAVAGPFVLQPREGAVDRFGVYQPSDAAIKAATPHVEAARATTDLHASHHARAALIDAWHADHPEGAVR